MKSVDICRDGVRTRAVRTPTGIRVEVLDPDPRIPEGEAGLLASFDCSLSDLLLVRGGRRLRAEREGRALEIATRGPLVEVRYEPGDGTQDLCETFRRDYYNAMMRLAGA